MVRASMSTLQQIIDATLNERRLKGWGVFRLRLTSRSRPFYAGDATAKKILPIVSNAVREFGKQVDLQSRILGSVELTETASPLLRCTAYTAGVLLVGQNCMTRLLKLRWDLESCGENQKALCRSMVTITTQTFHQIRRAMNGLCASYLGTMQTGT